MLCKYFFELNNVQSMIDEVLTRECLFCGSILLDMIDNDIKTDQGKDYEFYNGEDDKDQVIGANLDEEEWDI